MGRDRAMITWCGPGVGLGLGIGLWLGIGPGWQHLVRARDRAQDRARARDRARLARGSTGTLYSHHAQCTAARPSAPPAWLGG